MGGIAKKEFVIIDESGDPGPEGDPIYILVALHADEGALHAVRRHLTAFRYYESSVKEFKDARWASKPLVEGRALARFLNSIAGLADEGQVTTTANWLRKETYKANGGPHLGNAMKFRNFQLRLLLERHVGRSPWGAATDLVIDRWAMSEDQRRNLEDYLKNNYRLRPVPWITLVDSAYCDFVQAADVISRLVRRSLAEDANPEEKALTARLADLAEITRGLY